MNGQMIWESMGLTHRTGIQNYDTRMFAQQGYSERLGFGEIWLSRDDYWHQYQDSPTQAHEFGQLEYGEGSFQSWDGAAVEWVLRSSHPPYDQSPDGMYQAHLPMELLQKRRYPGFMERTFFSKYMHVRDRLMVRGGGGVELLELINDVDVERPLTCYLFGMTNSPGEVRQDGPHAIQIVEHDNHGHLKYSMSVSLPITRCGFTQDYQQWERIRRKAGGLFPPEGSRLVSETGRIYFILELQVVLPPLQCLEITTGIRYVDRLDGELIPDHRPITNATELFEANRLDWEQFYETQMPQITCDQPEYAREIHYLFTVNRLNAMRARGIFRGQSIYCGKYLRGVVPTDSAGGAAAAGWLRGHLAEEAIQSIFDAQFKNGLVSQIGVAGGAHLAEGGFEHVRNPAETIPPPEKARSNAPITGLLAYDIYRRRGDERFIQALTLPLQKWIDWWFSSERDPDGDGLCDFIGNMESSLDDTLRTADGRVTAIELNVYLYATLIRLGELWQAQGDANQATQCRQRADRLKKQINALCWNEQDGFYYDLAGGKQTGVMTAAAFQTLATDIPDQHQVEALIRHLLNPNEFWTTMPASGVAKSALPNTRGSSLWDYWNMFNMTWFTLEGLWQRGYQHVAAKITWRMLRLTQWADEPMAPAVFNGRTGLMDGCAADHTFSCSTADFFMRYIAGLHPDSVSRKVAIAPWIGELQHLSITGVPYCDGIVSVAMVRESTGLVVRIKNQSTASMQVHLNPAWSTGLEVNGSQKVLGQEISLAAGAQAECRVQGTDAALLHDEWHEPWRVAKKLSLFE